MEKVVIIGTRHPIQRGEYKPQEFKVALLNECQKHGIKVIAEEINKDLDTVASILARAPKKLTLIFGD